MTDRPFLSHDGRGKRALSVIFLILAIAAAILIAGCIGEEKTVDTRNFSGNQTAQFTKEIKKTRLPTPNPLESMQLQPRNQVIIVDFKKFLTDWNERMHWGFSVQQIENYNRTLEDGVLMKYQTKPGNTGNIAWDIPDIKIFCFEFGDEIGLSENQTEMFAAAADDYYLKGKIAMHKPPAIDILSLDNCSIQIERGKQKQINITYKYTPGVSPGTARFTSTKTPLTLAFDPSEFTVKPNTEFQAVTIITASSSLEPRLYQFGITINGKNTSEVLCGDNSLDKWDGQRMINVTVL